MQNNELSTTLVPTRPILDELLRSDNGERWNAARNSSVGDMVQAGLCGLLYPDDTAHLTEEHRSKFLADIRDIRGKLHLEFLAPKDPLERANLNRLSNAGTSIIAGLAYAPTTIQHTREVVQTVLSHSDVINENAAREDISIVFQGGARISNAEYTFAKDVCERIARFEHASKKFVTGGGRGIMRAPHSGAKIAAMRRGSDDTTSCGISCGKIIAAEPPNSLVEKLAVFEQIERRLEAFARTGHLTVFFPGGTGTFEELLYVLAVLMEEKNADSYYSFLLAGNKDQQEYYDIIINTLKQSLGEKIVEDVQLKKRVCIGTPDYVASRILKEAEIARWNRRKEMELYSHPAIRMDFQGKIHIPKGLREAFSVTRENVSQLQLHRDQPAADMIVNLRRFVYSVTCACISKKEREEVKNNGPFIVSGDPTFTKGIDELLQAFVARGRMNGDTYIPAYAFN